MNKETLCSLTLLLFIEIPFVGNIHIFNLLLLCSHKYGKLLTIFRKQTAIFSCVGFGFTVSIMKQKTLNK